MNLLHFEYRAVSTVEEAVALRLDVAGARFLAGGTDLITKARFGGLQPELVIDIKGIPGLNVIRERPDGSLGIGATVTVAQAAAHPLVRERYPVLRECCDALGSYPLRNRATVAGNLCNASPCADTSAALLALDAILVAVGPGGQREIPLGAFIVGPGQSALQVGELVTEVRIPAETAGGRGVYGRIARRKGVDISTVAVLVAVIPRGTPRHRVTLLSVAPTPLRVEAAERILDEKGPAGVAEAALAARNAATPITDLRGTAEYRREMVGVLLERGARALATQEDAS